jgi:hypothetical protein
LFVANGTDRRLGESFELAWYTFADTCTPSGGAPNDGWTNNSFGWSTADFFPRVAMVGTYTYTLNCSAGPLSVQQSVTVTFEDSPPYVTASVSPSTTTYSASPADYITINWTTNLAGCGVNSTPNLGAVILSPPPAPGLTGFFVDGPEIIAPQASGTYTVSVTCSSSAAVVSVTSAPMTVTVRPSPPPTATISIKPSPVAIGQNYTVTWSSTNAAGCAETGSALDLGGGVWGITGAPSGTETLQAGSDQYTFDITCNSIDPNVAATAFAQAELNVELPSATLAASPTSLAVGGSFTLTWSSAYATGCTASGGGADGPWTGARAPSGSAEQTATTAGTFVYTMTCSEGNVLSNPESVTVKVSASSSSGGSSGGHGGGGAIGWLELSLLITLIGLGRTRLLHPER